MIRIGIVDDEAPVRAGLREILQSADDLIVVGEASGGSQAVDLARRHRPDVLLMDVRMPDVDGLTATELVRSETPSTAVVVLTTFALDEYVHRALRAGAAGFLLKDTDPRDLIAAVRAVAGGDAILSPGITRVLLDHYVDTTSPRAARARRLVDELTDREAEVLVHVGSGQSNTEIARELHVSEGTVKAHVSKLLLKLGCDNRVQVAIVAHEAGLLG